VSGVAGSFFVMVFVANAMVYFVFLKDRKKQTNAAKATNKNPRQKNCLKLC
jgi:hypothetical protein